MSAGAELDPGEARRRSRISKANTGKVGWAPRTGHSVVEYNVSIGVCARRESKDIGGVLSLAIPMWRGAKVGLAQQRLLPMCLLCFAWPTSQTVPCSRV